MAISDDGRVLVCGYCTAGDCANIGRGPHHWADMDDVMDALVAEEDRLAEQEEPVDDNEDYLRSLLYGQDI